MPVVLQEVDPDDLTTVLWDFADSTGVANPGTVKTYFGVGGTFNLSAPGVNIDTSDRLGDGAQDVTFSYDDIVTSSFRMKAQATNYDNLRQGIGVLQRILAADGVMRFIPSGSSNTFYIYRTPSSIPALFTGDELELYQRLALFDSPEGIEIVVNRERLLRGPTLLASVNALSNGTLLTAALAATGVAGWTWDSTTNITESGYGASLNWPNQSYRFTIGTTGSRQLQQTTGTGTAAPGDVWTFSFYAKATGGSLCKVRAYIEFQSAAFATLASTLGTLTTLSSTEQRLTLTTAAAPASTSRVLVTMRFTNGDATTYTVDLRRTQLEKAASASQFRVGAETVYQTVGSSLDKPSVKSLFVYNPGDANALARLTLTPAGTSNPIAALLARKSEGLDVNLLEAVNQMSSAASSARTRIVPINTTMYGGATGDTSSQADANSTLGNAARTVFTNQSSLVRRWRWVSTPTDPEALHGTWDVYAAVRGETGNAFRICMHWQAANRDPVTEVEDEITYDTTDAASSVYTPLLLGQVTFDADAGDTALTIEGWAARDVGTGGTGFLWWDVVYLIPADEQQTLVQVPGFRRGRQSEEVWLGSELTVQVSGAVAGSGSTATAIPAGSTKVVLQEQYEGVGTPPSSVTTGGLVWAAGRHIVRAFVVLQEPAPANALTFGSVRIRKAPGVGNTVGTFAISTAYSVGDFIKPTNANRNGRTYRTTTAGTSAGSEPAWGTTNGGTTSSGSAVFTETTIAATLLKSKEGFTSTRFSKSVAADTDGSTAYEGIVLQTAGTVAGRKIHVMTLKHSTQRVVDNGYSVRMLGDLEVLQTANGTTAIDDMVKEGPYITLGPGLNVLWLDLWSQAPVAYDDIDPRGPLAYHDPTRSTTVSVDIIPRYWS